MLLANESSGLLQVCRQNRSVHNMRHPSLDGSIDGRLMLRQTLSRSRRADQEHYMCPCERVRKRRHGVVKRALPNFHAAGGILCKFARVSSQKQQGGWWEAFPKEAVDHKAAVLA